MIERQRFSIILGGQYRQGIVSCRDRAELRHRRDIVARKILLRGVTCDVEREAESVSDFRLYVRADVDSLIVSVLQDTILVEETYGSEVLELVRTTCSRDIVLLLETEVVIDDFLPISLRIYSLLLHPAYHFVGPVWIKSVHSAGQVMIVDELLCITELRHSRVVRKGSRTVIGDFSIAFSTALRSHEDYAVCTADTVDGGRRSILKHCDGSDVVRVKVVDLSLHTVYYDKRSRVVKGGKTSDQKRRAIGTRSTGALNGGHTGESSGKHSGDIGRRSLHKVLAGHLRHRTYQHFLLLLAISHDHGIFQECRVEFENHVDRRAVAHRHAGFLISDHTENQYRVCAYHLYGIGSLAIRHSSAAFVTLLKHIYAHFGTLSAADYALYGT